jgi:hypothetical protein
MAIHFESQLVVIFGTHVMLGPVTFFCDRTYITDEDLDDLRQQLLNASPENNINIRFSPFENCSVEARYINWLSEEEAAAIRELPMYEQREPVIGRRGGVLQQMRRAGPEKPIYSLEWTGAMMMDIKQNEHAREFGSYFPFKELRSVDAFRPVYQHLSEPRNERYRRWFEMEQAREFPKVFTTMLAYGVERMIHVPFHDYVGQGWNSLWWNWQGIVRYEGTRQRPVMIRKPVYYTYQALAGKLAGLSSAEVMGPGQDVIAYKFTFPDRAAVGVAWTETGERTVDLSRGVKASHVKLTPLVTELDANDRPNPPKTETVKTTAVRLTGTPTLIEAVEGRR